MGSTIHSDLLSLCNAFCMEAAVASAADSFFWTSLSQKHFLLSFYLFLLSLSHSLCLLLITKRKKGKKEFSEFILFYLFSLKLIHTALIRLCCALKSKLSFDALCVTLIPGYSQNSPSALFFFSMLGFGFHCSCTILLLLSGGY